MSFYLLSGQSIKNLRAAGKPFRLIWHKDLPDIEALSSSITEVAVNPKAKKFFLPKSNYKPLAEQERMVAQYAGELKGRMRIKDVDAVMGEAPDYAALTFAHLDKTREGLFGYQHDNRFTRTKTRASSFVAIVGDFLAETGLEVYYCSPNDGYGNVWVAPLVVPARTR